jgi:hypothetical protein
MAQPLLQTATPPRTAQLRLGVWIELVTIVWMTIEAAVALTTGFATKSVSLEGFGIDSLIELLAGSILLWRLVVEQREKHPLAALALVYFIVREGREALHEARTGETCSCCTDEEDSCSNFSSVQ